MFRGYRCGTITIGVARHERVNPGARGDVIGWDTSLYSKVTVSIPDGVIGIFHWHNPSGRTMALGLAQPLTEMSTRNISWVKAAGAYGWQPYHLLVPIVLKSGNLKQLEPPGPVQACNGIALPFYPLNSPSVSSTHPLTHVH